LEYRQGRGLESRKRKRSKKDTKPENANASKKAKVVGSGVLNEVAEAGDADGCAAIGGEAEVPLGDATAMALAPQDQVPPSILQHLTIGINQVTRKLESQIKASRQTVVISDQGAVSSEFPSQQGIKVVFVCRADIDPPMLIDHLPHLVSACNSSRKPPDFMKLVPLPKGAEFTLAAAMGLRRVAVIAVDSTAPELSSFNSLLQSVPTLTAPWLLHTPKTSIKQAKDLVPTHIKQVRTSAPKDMKAVKGQRAKGRAAKERIKKRTEPKSVKGHAHATHRVITTASSSGGGTS